MLKSCCNVACSKIIIHDKSNSDEKIYKLERKSENILALKKQEHFSCSRYILSQEQLKYHVCQKIKLNLQVKVKITKYNEYK